MRCYNHARTGAEAAATNDRMRQYVVQFRHTFEEIRGVTDQQLRAPNRELALAMMSEAARLRRSAPDFSGLVEQHVKQRETEELERITGIRQGLTVMLIVLTVVLIVVFGYTIWRIEQSLAASIGRQVRRTEAMVGGMADGVMLVDGEGKVVFINPAGQQLLGAKSVGTPIFRHAEVYRLRSQDGRDIDANELPAAQALATGRAVHDTTLIIGRPDRSIAISMSATPLQDDGRTSGVVVTFRDITERRQLEETTQQQAERAQILADAGAFFSSNIDPVWVTQAIAERVAEVLGDWSAVILKSSDSNELRVASIYHREMASLGLAWSYIYRQPLVVGEGIIGQVVSTGYPSLTQNLGASETTAPGLEGGYHAAPMKLASLLILPLRTRREMLGALVIAANDPDRAMNDERLPLAEILAERAALAIENAKL